MQITQDVDINLNQILPSVAASVLLLLLLLAVIRIPHDSATTPVSLCSHSFVMTQGAPSPFLPLSRCHYHSALFMSRSVTRLQCLCLRHHRKPGCVGSWM